MVGVSGDEKCVQDFDRENEMKRSLARISHIWVETIKMDSKEKYVDCTQLAVVNALINLAVL